MTVVGDAATLVEHIAAVGGVMGVWIALRTGLAGWLALTAGAKPREIADLLAISAAASFPSALLVGAAAALVYLVD